MSKTSGLSAATLVPVGAKLAARYWTVANSYGIGEHFPSHISALAEAIAEKQKAVEQHGRNYAGQSTFVPLPETITIDLRWDLKWDHRQTAIAASGTDLVAERITYENLTEAREALARRIRYTKED